MDEQLKTCWIQQALVVVAGIASTALIVAALAYALGGSATSRAYDPTQVSTAPPFQAQPLAAEWRWSPQGVDYEHMYREQR